MGRTQGLSLLGIAAIAWIVLAVAVVCAVETCDCYWPNCCHVLSAKEQQKLWNAEAFRFLYSDDCNPCFGYRNRPAYASGLPLGNATPGYWQAEAQDLYLAGLYAQAAASYAKAVKLDPSLTDGWLNMGNALYFLGRYRESLEAYDALLQLQPGNANALQGKGQALLALNRTDEGQAALKASRMLQGRSIVAVGSSGRPAVEPVVVGDYTI